MANKELEFTKVESLPTNLNVYVADDGTIFYDNVRGRSRLFIKWQDKEIDAVLPPCGPDEPEDGQRIETFACYGNALYFTTNKKVYKAVSPTPNTIDVVFVRDILPVELKQVARLWSHDKDGKEYVYRLCDDPFTGSIQLTVNDGRLFYTNLVAIHRGKAFFAKPLSGREKPVVREFSEKEIRIDMPGEMLLLLNARDNSRYIYFTDRFHSIYTLDTEKMEFLTTLKFGGGLQIINIASVFDGMMMVEGVRNNDVAGFTTILPDGYYTPSDDALPRWWQVTKQAFVDGMKSVLFNPS